MSKQGAGASGVFAGYDIDRLQRVDCTLCEIAQVPYWCGNDVEHKSKDDRVQTTEQCRPRISNIQQGISNGGREALKSDVPFAVSGHYTLNMEAGLRAETLVVGDPVAALVHVCDENEAIAG